MACRLVHGLLLHRCLIHALVKPETMGLGKPRGTLVRKNIALVGSVIYEILRRSQEGEFPKATLMKMQDLSELRNPLVQIKAQFMRMPHLHVAHIHEPHVEWKKDHHTLKEKTRKQSVASQRKKDKKKAGGDSDSDTDDDSGDDDSDDDDADSEDDSEDDGTGKKGKGKKGKGNSTKGTGKKKSKDKKKGKKEKVKKKKKKKTNDKKSQGKAGDDSEAETDDEDGGKDGGESKSSGKKSKKEQPMTISTEKTPEVLRGAFKIRKTKVMDNAGNVVKRSKEQFRKKFIQLTHDCIYQYADKELTILEGEFFLRNIEDLREKKVPDEKWNYAFTHKATDDKDPEDLNGQENVIDTTIEFNFASMYEKDTWLSRIKMWKRREHPVYHQQHSTISDTDLAEHLFPFRRFKKGRKQLDDHWLEEQSDKLNEWVKAVVKAVITRMTPEGAAKQDEAANENKTMETPR
jgi:hypothetical protein